MFTCLIVGFNMSGLQDLVQPNTGGDARELAMAKLVDPNQFNKMNTLYQIKSRFESPALVAALMGNIEHETGGTFNPGQEQNGGGPGRGLIQMEGDMLDAYEQFLVKNNTGDGSTAQAEFIKSILSSDEDYDIGAGHRKKMQEAINTNSPEIIAEEFMKRVERPSKPHLNKRLKATQEWYKKIGDK